MMLTSMLRKEPAEVSNTHSWSAVETEIEPKSLASKPEVSIPPEAVLSFCPLFCSLLRDILPLIIAIYQEFLLHSFFKVIYKIKIPLHTLLMLKR